MDVQVKAKYSSTLVDLFRETFCHLPLAHVLNGRIFVVHGGLFARDGVTLDELRRLDRVKCARTCCTCLWAAVRPGLSAVDGLRPGRSSRRCRVCTWAPRRP